MGVDYVDLYLIHWPGVTEFIPYETRKLFPIKNLIFNSECKDEKAYRKQTWLAMEKILESGKYFTSITLSNQFAGKAKAIGVSNYTLPHLQDLMTYAKVIPQVNQIEIHVYLKQYFNRFNIISAKIDSKRGH